MLKYLPSCYSALSFLPSCQCSYILLKKNYFKAFSLFFSLKNIFYFSLFFFYSFLLLCSDLPFLSSSFYFFFFLALWNRSPCGSPLEAISRLGFEPMKLLPFQFFFNGFRWWVTMAVICGFELEARWWDRRVHGLDLWVTILFWWLVFFARWLWFCLFFFFFKRGVLGWDFVFAMAGCFCGGWLWFWWMVVVILCVFFFFFSSCRWLWLPQWCCDLWWW